MTYELNSGAVVAKGESGRILWTGKPDGYPAKAVLPLPESEDAVVLLDYMAGPKVFANLVRISPTGEVVWRSDPPETSMPDAWVQCEWRGNDLYVNSWSGYRVKLDLATGRPRTSEFVK